MTEEQALIETQAVTIQELKAEIARLNRLLNDINAAWQADRATPTKTDRTSGTAVDDRLTRPAGDRAVYEQHESDKER